MVIVWLTLVLGLVISHVLIFYLIRVGIRDSKKEPAISPHRRR